MKKAGLLLVLLLLSMSTFEAAKANSNIILSLKWNSDAIVNGREFPVEINAYGLEEKDYDLKIYIYKDDKNKPISQTYSENDLKWAVSSTYLKNFLKNGESKKEANIRIKKGIDLVGEAKIGVRIREAGSRSYIQEKDEPIIILKDNNSGISGINNNKISVGMVIEEQTESIKSHRNIVYQSKNELIKKYSIISFIILIAVFFILLILSKKYHGWKNKGNVYF